MNESRNNPSDHLETPEYPQDHPLEANELTTHLTTDKEYSAERLAQFLARMERKLARRGIGERDYPT